MDKAALVTTDLTTGVEVLRILDRSVVSISVALWLYSPEYGDWRFVLSSKQLDSAEPSEAYGLVRTALAAGGLPAERTPIFLILKMSDPFIRVLRRMFGKTKSVEGMRLGGQLIGDRFVEAGLVYRIQ
jgi:hypothetical protein